MSPYPGHVNSGWTSPLNRYKNHRRSTALSKLTAALPRARRIHEVVDAHSTGESLTQRHSPSCWASGHISFHILDVCPVWSVAGQSRQNFSLENVLISAENGLRVATPRLRNEFKPQSSITQSKGNCRMKKTTIALLNHHPNLCSSGHNGSN